MPDDVKSPASPLPEGESKPTADKPTIPGGVKATASGSVRADAKTPSEKSEPTPTAPTAATPTSATPASVTPAAVPAKPAAGTPPAAAVRPAAAPPKPPAPAPTPWDSPMIAKLKGMYGSGIDPLTYLGQNFMVVDRSLIPEILQVLRNEEQFDYCVDITAVHYPQREKQFDVLWVLYSYARNERIRVKTQIRDGESVASSVPIWPAANWLEREVWDMFGIKFEGHPELKRILLPEEWKGHPLRKDYNILKQDSEWVQINLGIESGQ
jgi:NADH-quinone oxidoreductase subunit C